MADWLTREQRARNMAAIRSAGTSPERRLAELLRSVAPRRRIIEHPLELPGKPDFYLPGLRVAVFVDGCFWHGCPTHGRSPEDNADYWGPKLARNKRRDRRMNRELRKLGITPIRVWEHDVKRDAGPARRRLERALLVASSTKHSGSSRR